MESGEEAFFAKQCKSCGGHYAASRNVCPYCGAIANAEEKAIEVLPGELKKIESRARALLVNKAKKRDGWSGVVQQMIANGSTPKKATDLLLMMKPKKIFFYMFLR